MSSFSSRQSTLFITTISFLMNISAIIMHSAVWVWIPLLMSITKNIKSMIWAPPIIVLISEACPGQSTSVNWKYFYLSLASSVSGTRVTNEENPRSRVIPLYLDCGLLSKLAVDATWVNTLHMDVLPESTWPRTPTLMFMQSLGLMAPIYYLPISNSSLSIWVSIMLIIQSANN